MRALIVDDEELARRRLARMIATVDGVEVVGEASDGIEALERVAELRPDVVFLDIRMPGLDGMTLAKRSSVLPHVIFTTAYDAHAVEAFDAGAVDYLLKPIRQPRLERAIERARERLEARAAEREADGAEPAEDGWRLSAHHGGVLHVFDAREITRFHAADKYTVFVVDGRELLIEVSLAQLEKRLAPYDYVRVHRAELVGLGHVRALEQRDGVSWVRLSDGQRARVSRRHAAELKRRLSA